MNIATVTGERTFSTSGTTALPRYTGIAVMAAFAAGFVYLAVLASEQAYTAFDLRVALWVQGVDVPGLGWLISVANFLTDGPMAVTIWFSTVTFLVLRGRPLEAIAVFIIVFFMVADGIIATIVDRPVDAIVGVDREGTFPSGHVTGSLVLYGLLAVLTLANFPRGRVRVVVPAAAVLIVALVSFGRVYASAHWPTDVIASYFFGGAALYLIASFYLSVRNDTFHLPRPHLRRGTKAESTPTLGDGRMVAHSIASTVILDPRAGTASKEYKPPAVVRALYRFAFQAPFAYAHRRDALEAGAAKRVIASSLIKHQFGRDMVAGVVAIDDSEGRLRFVTEYVPGQEPDSNREVEREMSELFSFFKETGLPTWQISPANPHAYSNFIRTPRGDLKLIDLESSLVSFSVPFTQLLAYVRDGNFPVFDDVDFVRLRRYVEEHHEGLVASLGLGGAYELEVAINTAEHSTLTWKAAEPRIWGRALQAAYSVYDRLLGRPMASIRSRLDGAEAAGDAFSVSAVDRWVSEGRITAERARELEQAIESDEVQRLMKNLGAHLVLSLLLRFPLGSIGRFGWTVVMRQRARRAYLREEISAEEYAGARSIHSVPVMLLSLIPLLVAGAYLASGTLRRSGLTPLLIDQLAYHLPFSLYRRLHLAGLAAPKPAERMTPAPVATSVRIHPPLTPTIAISPTSTASWVSDTAPRSPPVQTS